MGIDYFDDDYLDEWVDSIKHDDWQLDDCKEEFANDISLRTFQSLREIDKFAYLYNQISKIYSYLSTIKEVEKKRGKTDELFI